MIQYPNGQLSRQRKYRKTGKYEEKRQPWTEQKIQKESLILI